MLPTVAGRPKRCAYLCAVAAGVIRPSISIMNSKQKLLYKTISDILWEKWDPIGVYDTDSEWSDEYDSYVPHIYRLTIEGNDSIRIAQSLTLSVTQSIGMSADPEHDLYIAKLIVKSATEILG